MIDDINQERWVAAEKNKILYEIIEILDRHDFGGVGTDYPGEYASEGKEVYLQRYAVNSRSELEKLLRKIVRSSFGFRAEMLAPKRYYKAANEIYGVLLRENNHKDIS